MPSPLLLVVGVVVGALVGALVAYLWVGNRNRERDLVSNAEREKLLSDAETQMKEMVLEAKEEAHRIRLSLEQEVRDARAELQRSERRSSARASRTSCSRLRRMRWASSLASRTISFIWVSASDSSFSRSALETRSRSRFRLPTQR